MRSDMVWQSMHYAPRSEITLNVGVFFLLKSLKARMREQINTQAYMAPYQHRHISWAIWLQFDSEFC